MKKTFFCIACFICLFMAYSTPADAQSRRHKKEVMTPEDSPEGEEQEAVEEQKEKTKERQKPLTKQQGQRAMKEREKNEEEAYNEHHDRIQQEETRKRMKKNAKRAKYANSNKKPNLFQRMMLQTGKK